VRYNNPGVANRFGGNGTLGSAQNRMDFRGRGGNQVLQPGGGAGLGGGLGAGNRPGAGGGGPGGGLGAANRPSVGGGNRANIGGGAGAANRRAPGGGGRSGNNALANIGSGRQANIQSARGRASLGGGGGARFGGGGGGGGARFGGGGGGGGRVGGGGGGARGGGGGRRSDIRLKHDVALLGYLPNGLGLYRFVYNGGHTAFVGVVAQEVQAVMPEAVARGSDGYLRVFYGKLGLKFETYDEWLASGALIPAAPSVAH